MNASPSGTVFNPYYFENARQGSMRLYGAGKLFPFRFGKFNDCELLRMYELILERIYTECRFNG